jgi:hypothetical protein
MDSSTQKVGRIMVSAVLALMGAQWIYSGFTVATNPQAASIPADDYRQYIAGWSSGIGLKETIAFLKEQAALPGKPVLVSVGGFGRHGGWVVQPQLAGVKGVTVREGFVDTPEVLLELALAARENRVFVLEEAPVYELTPALLATANPKPKVVFSFERTLPKLARPDGALRVWEVSSRTRVRIPMDPGAPVPAGEKPSIESVVNPNGLEGTPERRFFWVGAGATSVIVRSGEKGVLKLEGEFRAGPSVAGKAMRDLLVTTSSGYEEAMEVGTGPVALNVPVEAGRTRIQLIGLDSRNVAAMPNGDKRPLLIGVDNLHVAGLGAGTPAPAKCSVTVAGNAYPAEKTPKGGWFRWVSTDVEFRLFATKAGTIQLTGEYLSSVRPAKIQMTLEDTGAGVLSVGARQDKMEPIPALELAVPAGFSTLVLRTDKPGVKPPGDPRTLSFLVSNVTAKWKESGAACEVRP